MSRLHRLITGVPAVCLVALLGCTGGGAEPDDPSTPPPPPPPSPGPAPGPGPSPGPGPGSGSGSGSGQGPQTPAPTPPGPPARVLPLGILDRDLGGPTTLLIVPLSVSRSSLAPTTTRAQAQAHGVELARLFADQSHGRMDLRVTATQVLDLPQSTSYYVPGGSLSMVRLRTDITALAARAGHHLPGFDYVLVLSPKFWPGKTGFARAWKFAFNAGSSVELSAHELGHTFGWSHAARWDCSGSSPICPSGNLTEDGDHFDLMGKISTAARRFGPWKQTRAGWLAGRETLRVTRSGDYKIKSLAGDPATLGADEYCGLELRIDALTSYWVFHRGDEPLVDDGVLITKVTNQIRGQSILYDMTPSSAAGWRDAHLRVGQTFSDPGAGVTVRVLGQSGGSVNVRVTVRASIGSIPQLPIMQVVSPTRHDTVSGTWTFEANAFDPSVGLQNGDGLRRVTLRLNGVVMVVSRDFFSPPYRMSVNTTGLADGQYRLFIEVETRGGTVTQNIAPLFIDNTGPSL